MHIGISIAYGPISFGVCDSSQRVLGQLTIPNTFSASENLILELDAFLKKISIRWENIESIGVAVGPGGYTSLRIGVTLAKTISQMRQILLRPFSTLEAIAFQYRYAQRPIFSIIGARKDEVNVALFASRKGNVFRLTDDCSVQEKCIYEKLEQIAGDFIIAGQISDTFAELTVLPCCLEGATLALMAGQDSSKPLPLEKIIPVYSHSPNTGTIKKEYPFKRRF